MPLVTGFAVALLALLLTACASTQPVRDFSSASHAAMAEVKALPASWTRTCDLNRVYQTTEQPTYCVTTQEAAIEFAAAAKVLDEYLVQLGALAGIEGSDVSKPTSDLVNKIAAAKKFTSEEKDGISDLASAVASVATESWRDEAVWEHMKSVDSSIQTTTEALARVITDDYYSDLDGAKLVIDSHVRQYTSAQVIKEWNHVCRAPRTSKSGSKPCRGITGEMAFEAWQRNRLDDSEWLAARRIDATSTAEHLNKLGETHHWLVQNAGKVDMAELIKRLGTIVHALPD